MNWKMVGRAIRQPSMVLEKARRIQRHLIISRLAKGNLAFVLVQIGANDGVTNDPVHGYVRRFGWRGLFVEPQPDAFESLKKNYSGVSGLAFENAAITRADGEIDFFVSPESALSSARGDEWFAGRNAGRSYARRRELGGAMTTKVPSLTLKSLLRKHAVERIDLLQIDAEGYDLDILAQLDFSRIQPKMISFEHHHFSAGEIQECYSRLSANGYKVLTIGRDTFAYR